MSKLTLTPLRLTGPRFARTANDLNAKRVTNPEDPAFTVLAESGKVHIHNVSGRVEGVTYSIMAVDEDGKTVVINRKVALKPYQAVQDDADGYYAMAAWTKN